jgi:hypothetical protein
MIPQDFPSCYNSPVPALAWLLLVRDGAGSPGLRSKIQAKRGLILQYLDPPHFRDD